MPEAEVAIPTRLARQSAVRAAILEAGRRLAARTGIVNLSLSGIAAEAGLHPSTVFGHFRNKDDLLLAVVAEDLAGLARLMRDRLAPKTTRANPTGAGDNPSQHTLCSAPIVDGPIEESEERGSQEAAQADATIQLDESVQPPAEGAPDVPLSIADSQFPQHASEHLFVEIERRLKGAEASIARSVALSEAGTKNFFDRIEAFERQQKDAAMALMQRLEETERRQRNVTSELRTAMNDVATRIEILEAARRLDHSRGADKSLLTAVADSNQPSAADATPLRPESTHETDTYRDAAERAASAAAALAALEQVQPAASAVPSGRIVKRRVLLSRRHSVIAIGVTLATFVLGTLIAFSVGQTRGRSMRVALLQAHSRPLPLRPQAARHLLHGMPSGPTGSGKSPERSAQTGTPKANLLLGLQYLHGDGVAADTFRAAKLIRQAAERRYPVAQYWLGALYEHGDGVGANPVEAVRWYDAAAVQGNRKAMHALGVAYAQGFGTHKDYAEAARWFTRAAELGLVNSEFNLGVLYERGLGVPQSLRDAYRWYYVAAAQGDQESRARIDALKTQLTPDEMAAAEQAAANFHPGEIDRNANETPTLAGLPGH